jgi:glycosyltransferase involved in cell wall biosynthesis
MLSKLRICYLAGTLGQGGAERQLFYAVQALRQSGASVRVLSLDPGGFWETPINELGVPVTRVGEDGSRLRRVLRILKHLREEPAEILQSQHFYTNAYAAVAALLLNCEGIGALRSNGQFDLTQTGHVGGRINLHLPRILAANSRSSIRYALERGIKSSRLHFLPNVVDTDRFTPADPEAVSRDGSAPIILLAAGRLTREKRFDRFINIVHGLRVSGLNVQGWIVGATRANEDLRPELERQAAALGLLPDAVQFLGSVAEMSSIYRRSSICVLTSEHEGTPNVLLESMSVGLPVVATNVGGVPEIVKDGETGFLVPGEDLNAQVTVIARLVRDSDLRARIARQGRAYVEENHSVHRLPAHLNSLYEAVFSCGRAGKSRSTSIAQGAKHAVLARNPFPANRTKEEEVYEH